MKFRNELDRYVDAKSREPGTHLLGVLKTDIAQAFQT
jgi:hypothetical protein